MVLPPSALGWLVPTQLKVWALVWETAILQQHSPEPELELELEPELVPVLEPEQSPGQEPEQVHELQLELELELVLVAVVVEPPLTASASRGPQSPCIQRRPSSRMPQHRRHPRPRRGLNSSHHHKDKCDHG